MHFSFCLQHDAACRVIARLKKERDESRQLLTEAERQLPEVSEVATANAGLSNGKRGMLAHLLLKVSWLCRHFSCNKLLCFIVAI